MGADQWRAAHYLRSACLSQPRRRSDMEFLHTDTPDDVELKLQVLEIYNHKLDERERRRELLLRVRVHIIGHARNNI